MYMMEEIMAKPQTNQKFIFKIHSKRLRDGKWDLSLSLKDARENDEVISLSDSIALRMICDILGRNDNDIRINQIKKSIKKLRREESTRDIKKQIKKLYEELDILQYEENYVNVVIDRESDYKKMFDKGFKLNNIKYKRLLGTTGGVKNNTIVFVSEKVYDKLWNKIENGRDTNVKIVPAKLEAYKALTCSSSIPVSNPNGILVVSDCEIKFKEDVILLDDSVDAESPKMTLEKDYDVSVIDNDGYGLILPKAMKKWAEELGENYIPSGMCIRNSWTKGFLFTFDFIDFSEKIAKKNIVTDIWGDTHDINDIEVILTESMLKLANSYKSINHYLECCKENGYHFSITKVCPERLESERYTNYQFIQTYDFTEDQLKDFIKPTVDQHKEIIGLDYTKSLLFLRGLNLKKGEYSSIDEDYIKALSIDKNMINDNYIRDKIYKLLNKQINKAKTGVIRIRGNYSIVSGDVYMLAEHVFGLEPKGLLKPNCNYSKYWSDLGVEKVACFRAPMTSHNNIRLLDIKSTDEMNYWYRYMPTVTIFGGWDTATHALNGMDKDGDGVMTTDNKYLVELKREVPPIICLQKAAEKKCPTEEDLYRANINGFGDDIGRITNYITTMVELMAKFDKDSREYETLNYRVTCGQQFQQNAIDKTKGIICKPMPKSWYDFNECKYYEEDIIDKDTGEIRKEKDSEETIRDKKFLQTIVANKKPYFMCYIYPSLMREYTTYMNKANAKSMRLFRLTLDELRNKGNKSDLEIEFINKLNNKMPVGMSPSTVNRIAWEIEKEFKGVVNSAIFDDFDYSILKSDHQYSINDYNIIKRIYKSYIAKLTEYSQMSKTEKIDKTESMERRKQLKDMVKIEAIKQCPNEYELANILVDLCYGCNHNKQFAWDISGDVFVRNLLKRNNNNMTYLIQDDNGDIEYSYEKFKLVTTNMEVDKDDSVE